MLELHDALDAGERDALRRQLLHLTQLRDVAHRVAATAATRAFGGDEPQTVVLAQRLGVHPGEFGGDGDDVHRLRRIVEAVQPLVTDASVVVVDDLAEPPFDPRRRHDAA